MIGADSGSNSQSTTLEGSMLTITPLIRFPLIKKIPKSFFFLSWKIVSGQEKLALFNCIIDF